MDHQIHLALQNTNENRMIESVNQNIAKESDDIMLIELKSNRKCSNKQCSFK